MKFYTPKEVSKLTGRTLPTIYRWIELGLLRAAKIGEDGTKASILISEEDLLEFYKKNLTCQETFELQVKLKLKEIFHSACSLPDEKAGRLLKLLASVLICGKENNY